jgi:hypothetical protein
MSHDDYWILIHKKTWDNTFYLLFEVYHNLAGKIIE